MTGTYEQKYPHGNSIIRMIAFVDNMLSMKKSEDFILPLMKNFRNPLNLQKLKKIP